MKTKLLLSFFASILFAGAQSPISNYFSAPLSEFAVVSGTIDQTPTGPNANWNFSGLTSTETNVDTYTTPTAAQLADYPGTTQVFTITDGAMNTNQTFYKVVGSELSLTGAGNTQFTLDYNTDNAFIGTYPLTYGTSPTVDNIAGQIEAQGQTPNYTGTITTEVDAYGTLTFNVTVQGSYTGNVTRVRTVQVISFTVVIFPGTATIVTNTYYKDSDGSLVFRTNDGSVSVPGVGVNESFSTSEALITNTLSVEDNNPVSNLIEMYPNPARDVLTIRSNSIAIEDVSIMDINGRRVLTSNTENETINISSLKTGIYLVAISSESGTITKKLIKQ
ncbi:T9SS type A sorting domain-containing protein [Psychroserpens sp. Hel_I_66]|uniref:T9SS type A sorting domain-containing protein n=1 Tax=Psychroserpens sp. Hel_I_66 TaxID=1250004 RepID=UPI000645D19E|nr:T9SS type A sorting domain-containing protein [Psychroserpens sp. Hel_I_66]